MSDLDKNPADVLIADPHLGPDEVDRKKGLVVLLRAVATRTATEMGPTLPELEKNATATNGARRSTAGNCGRWWAEIVDAKDAEVARQWYERRIAVEQGHLNHLNEFANDLFNDRRDES